MSNVKPPTKAPLHQNPDAYALATNALWCVFVLLYAAALHATSRPDIGGLLGCAAASFAISIGNCIGLCLRSGKRGYYVASLLLAAVAAAASFRLAVQITAAV